MSVSELVANIPKPKVVKPLAPFNLSILSATNQEVRHLLPVKVLDITDGAGGNFHPEGLFSTEIFGRVGDDNRLKRFGYIKLNIPVLHPVIFSRLVRLKALYGEILNGISYAIFDTATNDFVKADELTGDTGYHFFVKHWKQFKPGRTNSSIRNLRINLIEKYKEQAFIENLIVLPAGLRDVEYEPDGRVSMDEVNEYYQQVLMITRNFPERALAGDEYKTYDRARMALTLKIEEIYNHFERRLSGKQGLIHSRFGSRRVFNGTRNVISSGDPTSADLSAKNRQKMNQTAVGMLQASKATLPKTIFFLKNGILSEIFDIHSNRVELINPETLRLRWVELESAEMDRWTTDEGLEKVINEQMIIPKRSRPVMVADHYIALVYKPPIGENETHGVYRIFRDIDQLPEHLNKEHVYPLTLIELIYLSGVHEWNTIPAFVTRYPIENMLSSYPTFMYVKTTVNGEYRRELNYNWEEEDNSNDALEYPKLLEVEPAYFDTISVYLTHLGNLGGDFDKNCRF